MLVLFLFVMLQDIISYRLTFHLSHISRYLHYLTCENNHELRSELCRGDERMHILVEILNWLPVLIWYYLLFFLVC